MRAKYLLIPLLAGACSAAPDDPLAGDEMRVTTPSFTLQPGEEKFYCYFTTLPSGDTGIHRVTSSMPEGSHHMIVFKTEEGQPDGTFGECDGFGNDGGIPVWLYASQVPEGELVLPEGVGLELEKDQHVMVNMHYINLGDEPLTASVEVNFETFAPGTEYTPAHSFISYNTQISVAPNSEGMAGGSCDVDPAAKFLMMSTHSHQYTMRAEVRDGGAMVLETLDWAHATVQKWDEPFYQFASGKLDYACQYRNTTNQPLTTGESAVANEMCMAVGLMFPADGDTFCLNSNTFQL